MQKVQDQVNEIRQQITVLDVHTQRRQQEIESKRNKQRDAREMLNSLIAKDHLLELDLELMRKRLQELYAAKSETKSTITYRELLKTIELKRKEISSKEDEVLVVLEEIDKRTKSYRTTIEVVVVLVEGFDKELKIVQPQIEEREERIRGLERQIRILSKDLPRKYTELFYKLTKKYEGGIFAEIASGPKYEDEPDVKYFCSGCCYGVPPESENIVLSGKEVVQCFNCQRILMRSKK